MKIAKRVRDLPPGEYAIPTQCDFCRTSIAFNRASECKWIVSWSGEKVIACCCSIKCAKEYIKARENEHVPSATR